MKKVNILAIGAHPDDIEFGCGGTLTKYDQRGHRLFLMVMTGGGSGAPSETRMAEQTAARQVLGAEEIFWGGYQDFHLGVDAEMIKKIESVIASVKPEFIFCHFPAIRTRTTGTWRRRSCPPRATSATCSSTRGRPPKTSAPRSMSTSPIPWRSSWRPCKPMSSR